MRMSPGSHHTYLNSIPNAQLYADGHGGGSIQSKPDLDADVGHLDLRMSGAEHIRLASHGDYPDQESKQRSVPCALRTHMSPVIVGGMPLRNHDGHCSTWPSTVTV